MAGAVRGELVGLLPEGARINDKSVERMARQALLRRAEFEEEELPRMGHEDKAVI